MPQNITFSIALRFILLIFLAVRTVVVQDELNLLRTNYFFWRMRMPISVIIIFICYYYLY